MELESEAEPPAKKARASKPQPASKAKAPTSKPKPEKASSAATKPQQNDASEKTYWLLKAEPESRFENGVDVRFSIDDLAAKTVPEPWDGTYLPTPPPSKARN